MATPVLEVIDAPIPCKTREEIRRRVDVEMVERKDARVKITNPYKKTFFLP
jgi:hypothetical protein